MIESIKSNFVRGNSIGYKPEFDGLRGIAICLVFSHHLGYGWNFGWLGVDIFFVLSGYLISKILQANYRDQISIQIYFKFISRRIMRLYPILIVNSILMLVTVETFSRESKIWSVIASLMSFKNFTNWGDTLGPIWSLSAEVQFYLIFPFINHLLTRHFLKYKKYLLGTYIFIVWIVALLVNLNHKAYETDSIFNLVALRPSGLILGALIATGIPEGLLKSKNKISDLLANMFLFILLIISKNPILMMLLTASIILHLEKTNTKGILSMKKFLQNKILVKIGLLSYSIYIWHTSILFLIYHPEVYGLNLNFSSIEKPVFSIIATLIISIISYELIEKPCLKLYSGKMKKRKP
jgi:peptidoglycan/LPS O-acetylase OafA/YrhL